MDYDNWLYSGPGGPHDDDEPDDEGEDWRESYDPSDDDNEPLDYID